MDTKQPLNNQPVELVLSFESAVKINCALDVVLAQTKNYKQRVKSNLCEGVDDSNVYTNNVLIIALNEEVTYLTDLQRAITRMLDNVADKYADELLASDKDLATMSSKPSKESEQTVEEIVKHYESVEDVHTPVDMSIDN